MIGTAVDYAAFGQWALIAVVVVACIALGWCLALLVEYRHQRKGPNHDAHA